MSRPIETPTSPTAANRLKWIGMVIGVTLLIAAIAVTVSQRQTLMQARAAIQQMPAERLAMLAGLIVLTVIANVFLTGLMFSMLISRYGRVGRIEMQALIAASTLLNYLPVRAGMLGRVAYHRAYNDIPLRHSAKAIVQAVALSGISVACLGGAILLSRQSQVSLWSACAIPLAAAAACALVPTLRIWMGAGIVRDVELLLNAVRYWAAFALIGSPIPAEGAIAFACLSALTTMVPFLSNGLGLREWAVGLALPLLTTYQMELGITADLVNRAAEMVVAIPLGVLGMSIVARLRRAQPTRGHI